MAPPSSDMKPPAPEERGDTSLDLQAERLQNAAPDSPAKMSPARDTSDGTGATTNNDVKHADQRSSRAKKIPTLEAPDDIISITNEKNLPPSTPVSSVERSDLVDKATDGTPPDPDSPRSGTSVSSANKSDSLDNPTGTRSSPQVTSHDAESTSWGKTSLTFTDANDISSTDWDSTHGSTAVSREDNSQADGASNDTSTSRPLKRKAASTPGQPPGAQGQKKSSKRMKSSTDSSSLSATESATISSGSAVSTSGPSIGTAATSNASAVPAESAHTQASTNTSATQGNVPAVPTTSGHTQTPTIAQSAVTALAPPSQISVLDHTINHLRQLCAPVPAALWLDTTPPTSAAQLGTRKRAKTLGMAILAFSMKKVENLNEYKVCRWLASNDVLPTLDQFRSQCMDNAQVGPRLSNALDLLDSPWEHEAELVASYAKLYNEIESRKVQFDHPHRQAMMHFAKWTRRLSRSSRPTIMSFSDECEIPEGDRFLLEICARALLTAFFDYQRNPNGFFRTLFRSDFVRPMTWQERKSREAILGFKRVVPGVEYRTPSLTIHRAAGAYGRAMKPRMMKKTNNTEEGLIATEKETKMADRHTKQLKAFETEATSHPDLLLAVNTGSVVNEPTEKYPLPNRIVDHKSVCALGCQSATTPSSPAQDTFARDKDTGRIIPAPKVSAASNNADPWTDFENLVFFTRFKDVHSGQAVTSLDEVPLSAAAISLMKWAAIAEVLPGRGIADCIEHYHQNIHILQYAQV